jgi:hypothetical protein
MISIDCVPDWTPISDGLAVNRPTLVGDRLCMTRASKQTIVADSVQMGSTAIRRASGLLEPGGQPAPPFERVKDGTSLGGGRVTAVVEPTGG